MLSSSSFFSPAETAIETKASCSHEKLSDSDLDTVYEIQRCVDWVSESGFQRVALQFPDELMCDSVAVTTRLEKLVPKDCRVFILGDTSYGSCCVDEVAAKHYNADCIIHYGRSCLSTPASMPVLFVFGQFLLDVPDCVEQFSVLFPDEDSNVIIMYDTVYTYACDAIFQFLKEKYRNLVLSELILPETTPKGEIGSHCADDSQTQIDQSQNNRTTSEDLPVLVTRCGRKLKLCSSKSLEDFSVFYIGGESLTLTNLMYSFNKSQFYSYSPVTKVGRKESVNINRLLMKRYYMIEKAKDAKIVGILIGTLGVSNYLDIFNRLKVLLKKAGKKAYSFIVGKVNVAKLANFMEIDIFVLVACPENTLLDSSEFYKPVVTPYEMELACNSKREWTGDYVTEFSQLLEGGSHHASIPETICESEETDVSLITGRLRRLGEGDTNTETGTAVVLKSDNMAVATQAESASEFLEMRSWKGLQQNLGDTPVTKAVEGQAGIAMGYNTEPSPSS